MSLESEVIYTLRAKHRGEALSHCKTRCAFLQDIIRDERTECLYAAWGELYGFDRIIALAQPVLDRIAARAGYADRAVFRARWDGSERSLLDALALCHREDGWLLLQLLMTLDQLISDTRATRLEQAVGFVVAELYGTLDDRVVPVRASLGSDLVAIFDEEVACRVWGTKLQLRVPVSPTHNVATKGRRPKGDGQHLARFAHWYYLAKVRRPPVTIQELSKEYAEMSDVPLQPKDHRDISPRADDGEVSTAARTRYFIVPLDCGFRRQVPILGRPVLQERFPDRIPRNAYAQEA